MKNPVKKSMMLRHLFRPDKKLSTLATKTKTNTLSWKKHSQTSTIKSGSFIPQNVKDVEVEYKEFPCMCMDIYTHTQTHTHTHTHTHIYINGYICINKCVCARAWVRKWISACVYTYLSCPLYIYIYRHTHTIYIYIYTLTHLHTRVRARTHTHTRKHIYNMHIILTSH